ncbi:MAG TPA: hypothetical protein H9892_03145, partial [Candidatus Protoclostridium stercorigallinarum]|nr:hypothetical protein [Candidatus Protoclostridium stercorigallinarum]
YGDMPDLLTYGHSISSVAQYAAGSFRFGRFDLVIFSLWLSAVFLSAGMITAFFSRSMAYALGGKAGAVAAVAGGVALTVAMIFTVNLNLAVEWATGYFALPSFVVQYGLPVLGAAAAAVCRITEHIKKKRRENDEKTAARENGE